jgi:putative FmdB family regulatory protein
MPSYQYKCPQCDIKLVVTRGINDPDPGYKCETCKITLTKVYSIGAVTFNGSGFYRTDK